MQEALSISFVLPMFNESDNIESTVNVLSSLGRTLSHDYEIVIVDDASTDAGPDIVKNMAANDKRIKLHRMPKNTKFGGAFAEGFSKASKGIIIYMDSDLPVGIEDVRASIPLIREADIVTGYSKVEKGDTNLRKMISRVYNRSVRTLFDLDVPDINSGYKIVRKDLIEDMMFISKSPFVDVELFLHARKKKARVCQYPLIFRSRTGGRSHIASIPFLLATFRDMIKVKLSYKGV